MNLLKVLMERDGRTEAEAKKLIKAGKRHLDRLIAKGETPLDFMMDEFGLEPDYLEQLMVYNEDILAAEKAAEKAAKKATRVSKFTPNYTGKSVYTCRDCGKKTRDTGEGEIDAELCYTCYTIAGLDNSLADGYITQEEYDAEVAALKAPKKSKKAKKQTIEEPKPEEQKPEEPKPEEPKPEEPKPEEPKPEEPKPSKKAQKAQEDGFVSIEEASKVVKVTVAQLFCLGNAHGKFPIRMVKHDKKKTFYVHLDTVVEFIANWHK